MLAMAAALACGCAHSPAPRGWLPKADASATDAFGGWLIAETGPARKPVRVAGELISVEPDSVLVFQGDHPVMLAKQGITKATLVGYDIDSGVLSTWATLGAISTLSHGAFLVFTLPMWSIAGGVTTSQAVHASMLEYPKGSWTEIAKYARFPQGLPAGVDRMALRRKVPG